MLDDLLHRIKDRLADELIDEVIDLPPIDKQALLLQNLQYRSWVLRAQVLARFRNAGQYGAFDTFEELLDRVGIAPGRLYMEMRVLDAIIESNCDPVEFIDQSVDDLAAQLDRRTLLVEAS